MLTLFNNQVITLLGVWVGEQSSLLTSDHKYNTTDVGSNLDIH